MNDSSLLTLDDFVVKLIEEKNYGTVSPEVAIELKNDLLLQLHDTLIARLLDKLSDQEITELNNFLDTKPNDEQLQQFVASKLSDPQTFIAGVLTSFRKTYLGLEV